MEDVVCSACRTERAQPSGMQGDVWDGPGKRGQSRIWDGPLYQLANTAASEHAEQEDSC